MTTKWYYAYQEYATEALCDAAVLSMKNKLDNEPTEYIEVTPVTQSSHGGWIIHNSQLTNEEIKLGSDGYYNIHSLTW